MLVYVSNNKTDFPILSDTAVALGAFDAIHTGHRAIIEDIVEYARGNKLKSVVYMFKNMPKEVIDGVRIPSVNSFEQRIRILEKMGVDVVVAEEFTEEFSQISAEDFVKKYLVKKLGAKYVVSGDNYHFGKMGKGDAGFLAEFLGPYGVKTKAIPCIMADGERVSSTRIRKCIEEGKIEEAEKLLGRCYSIYGRVSKGNQIGRLMDFPTANISIPKNCISLQYGVYITKTIVDGKVYPSITNVGGKPTVEENAECIETHIMEFSGDIYEKEIEIEFIKYIRGINKFSSIDELKKQIEKDKEIAKAYFKSR